MSLREQVEVIFSKELSADYPVRTKLAEGPPNTRIEVSGDLEETLQATINAVTHYCDALFLALLWVADAVDELRGPSEV
jgi:hypothetical protein